MKKKNEKSEKEKEINPEIEKILLNKNFWDITIKEFEKKIAGEIKAKEYLFICCLGTLVKNCAYSSFNVLSHSTSSAGKDYTNNNLVKIFPKNKVYSRTRITPAVLNYWCPEDSWDGKILYLPDISESIMNSEALKLMCSEGSHITTLDEKRKVIDIKIDGKPVIISTTANTTPNEEMINRFGIIQLTETKEQTKEIIKLQGQYAMKGISPKYNPDLLTAISLLKRHEVKIPFADKIAVVFPTEQVRERRNFPKFLDFVKAITCLYQYQRKEEKGYLISTYEDYDIARKVFSYGQQGLNSIPLNKIHTAIIEALKDEKQGLLSIRISEKMNYPITYQALFPHLNSLVGLRILEIYQMQDDSNRLRDYYKISNEYYKIKPIILPTSKELQVLIIKK